MTQQVGKAYRKHRGALLVLALAAAAATLVLSVLPAGAARVNGQVVNIGGQDNDCAAVSSTAAYSFRIVNPANNTTYTHAATGAKFKLTVNAANTKLGFTITGGSADDVVIKGGTKSNWYDYDGKLGFPVVSDTDLSAPPKGNDFYSISHTTFCYVLGGTIQGTVFRDSNGNATKDGFEELQSGWTVKLYNENGTDVSATYRTTAVPTNGTGAYKFEYVPFGSQYTVCEVSPLNSGTWGQTVPTTEVCSGSGEETRGHQFLFTADATKNFGNQQTANVACGGAGSATSTNVQYNIQLGSGGSTCSKTGTNEYVFEAWTEGTQQYAKFTPYSAVNTTEKVALVEKLTWALSPPNQNTTLLKYDDVATGGVVNYEPMLYCKIDPRTPAGSEFGLPAGLVASTVLPSGTRTDGDPHTSCILSSIESVSAIQSGGGTRTDYVFSNVDGFRSAP